MKKIFKSVLISLFLLGSPSVFSSDITNEIAQDYCYMAQNFFNQGDYKSAGEYTNFVLELESENQTALELRTKIQAIANPPLAIAKEGKPFDNCLPQGEVQADTPEQVEVLSKEKDKSEETEIPLTETSQADALQVEVPKIKTPLVETPRVESVPVETPQVKTVPVEVSQVEAVQVETPLAEVAPIETSKVEVVPVLKVEAPNETVPQVEAPKVEASNETVPQVDVPKIETPQIKTPSVETPQVKTVPVEVPQVEAVQVETPLAETPRVESVPVETPQPETPSTKATKIIIPLMGKTEFPAISPLETAQLLSQSLEPQRFTILELPTANILGMQYSKPNRFQQMILNFIQKFKKVK